MNPPSSHADDRRADLSVSTTDTTLGQLEDAHVVHTLENAGLKFTFSANTTTVTVTAYDGDEEMASKDLDLVALWESLTT